MRGMAGWRTWTHVGALLAVLAGVAGGVGAFAHVTRQANRDRWVDAQAFGGSASTPELLRALAASDDVARRAWAAHGLRRTHDAEAVRALIAIVEAPPASTLAPDRLGRLWAEFVDDRSRSEGDLLRRHAIESLGVIGDPKAIPPLLHLLSDEGARAEHATVERALSGITGQSFEDRLVPGESRKAWQSWWTETTGRWRATRLNVDTLDSPLSGLTQVGIVAFPDEGSDAKSLVVGCRGDQRVAVSIDWGPGPPFVGTVGVRYRIGREKMVDDAWQSAGAATYRDDGRTFVGQLLRAGDTSFRAEVRRPGAETLAFQGSVDGFREALHKVKCRTL